MVRLPPGGGSREAGGGARATSSFTLGIVVAHSFVPRAPSTTFGGPPPSRREAYNARRYIDKTKNGYPSKCHHPIQYPLTHQIAIYTTNSPTPSKTAGHMIRSARDRIGRFFTFLWRIEQFCGRKNRAKLCTKSKIVQNAQK